MKWQKKLRLALPYFTARQPAEQSWYEWEICEFKPLQRLLFGILHPHRPRDTPMPDQERAAKAAFLLAIRVILAERPEKRYNLGLEYAHLAYLTRLGLIFALVETGQYQQACNELSDLTVYLPLTQPRVRGGLELLMKKAEERKEVWD